LTSNNGTSAPTDQNPLRNAAWWNSTGANYSILANGSCANPAVHTIERTAAPLISGRYNGAAGTPFAPFADAGTPGLVFFTSRNTSYNNGIAGRFYGGTWINRALTTGERRALEVWQAQKTGVAV
jgi:hypothetical protein